jgi:hypothetical protein
MASKNFAELAVTLQNEGGWHRTTRGEGFLWPVWRSKHRKSLRINTVCVCVCVCVCVDPLRLGCSQPGVEDVLRCWQAENIHHRRRHVIEEVCQHASIGRWSICANACHFDNVYRARTQFFCKKRRNIKRWFVRWAVVCIRRLTEVKIAKFKYMGEFSRALAWACSEV